MKELNVEGIFRLFQDEERWEVSDEPQVIINSNDEETWGVNAISYEGESKNE